MSNHNDSTRMEPLLPDLHLLRRTPTQTTWLVEYPTEPDTKAPQQSFDRLGGLGSQPSPVAPFDYVRALARTPEPGETGLSEAEMIYLLPTYQSRLNYQNADNERYL